jgi:putative membrane protein
MPASRWHCVLLVSFLAILIWSGVNPMDQFIWYLEVFPAMIGAVVLIVIYHRV